MNRKKYKYLKSLLVLLTLSFVWKGCETPIDPDDLPAFVQKIVVNMVASTHKSSEMEVSLTASPYDSTDFPSIVDDAIVQFKVNGLDKTLTYNAATRKYEYAGNFDPGDQLQLSVSLQNRSIVSSSTIMPDKPLNQQSTLKVDGGIDAEGNTADLLTLQFDDDATQQNYYLLHVYYYSEFTGLFLPFDFSSTDAILSSTQTVKTNDGGYLFADETFSGRTKSILLVPQAGLTENNSDIKYLIELHSVSRDYFVYLKTLQDFRDSQDNTGAANTLGSAVVVHSNISGGLGIFGAQTVSSDTLR